MILKQIKNKKIVQTPEFELTFAIYTELTPENRWIMIEFVCGNRVSCPAMSQLFLS